MKYLIIVLSVSLILNYLQYKDKKEIPEISFILKKQSKFKAKKITEVIYKDKIIRVIDQPEYELSTNYNLIKNKAANNSLSIGLSQNKLILEHSFLVKNLTLGYIFNLDKIYIVNYSNLYFKYSYEY